MGCESDHLPSAEFKIAWRYVSIHPLVFMAWYLIKQRDNVVRCFLELRHQVCEHVEYDAIYFFSRQRTGEVLPLLS